MRPRTKEIPAWIMRLIGAGAMTVYPWILVSRGRPISVSVLRHEEKHLEQQGAWFKRAHAFGLLAWYFLYLFCLPVKWNPWRRKWETEAYTVQGYSPTLIAKTLRKRPYYLT